MYEPSHLRALIDDETDPAIALRRAIHRYPEIGHRELATTAAVAEHVATRSGLEPEIRASGVGLSVEVGSGSPVVAFRADLDALPISEESGLDYASEVPGVMHACGHDVHAAIAAGLVAVMAKMKPEGTIRFVFQPAEESVPGGAVELLDEGVMEGVSSAIAFHVDPSIPAGTIGLREGAITGASDRIRIELIGPGGHTSRPHQTVDLVQAAARVAVELPQLVQRVTDPRDPVALVFGRISGGLAENVVPTSVELAGTVRMFDLELWRGMPPLVERLVNQIVEPFGATAKVEYQRGAPPVVNDAGVVSAVRRASLAVLGDEGLLSTRQSLGAEDFAWYLEHVPGALVRLGAEPADRVVDLHSANFAVDEAAVPIGMLVGAAALVELLAVG